MKATALFISFYGRCILYSCLSEGAHPPAGTARWGFLGMVLVITGVREYLREVEKNG